jgi:hypothetical protein
MIPSGVYDATIVPLPGGTTGWAVNLRGTVIAAAFVGAYTPTQGDTVRVLVSDGVATVLGQVHAVTPASYGTVLSTAGQTAQVSTESGTVTAWFGGSAPANGSIVRLDWQTSIPWILSTLVSAPGGGGSEAPTAPPAPTTGTTSIPAIRSGDYYDPASGSPSTTFGYVWQFHNENANDIGFWQYTQSRLKSLAGKTITSVRIYLPPRYQGGGSYEGDGETLTAHIWASNGAIPPGGLTNERLVSIAPNFGGGWVKLPNAFGDALKDGGGVALYDDDSAGKWLLFYGTDIFPNSGQLEIKWSV